MSEHERIDELIRQKLSGTEAGGYSDAAWSGASGLLDNHFRMLLLKKALFIAVPVIALLGITWFALPDTSTVTDAPSVHEVVNAEGSTPSPSSSHSRSSDKAYESLETKTSASPALETAQGITLISKATASNAQDLKESKSTKVSDLEASLGSAIGSDDSKQEVQRLSNDALAAIESETSVQVPDMKVSDNRAPESSASAFNSTQSALNTVLSEMPTFEVGRLGAGDASSILSREKLKKDMLERSSPVFEITAGFGLLGAAVLYAPSPQPLDIGSYASLAASYNFNDRLFASTGVIYNQREAIIQNFSVITPDQKLQSRAVGYLDIPIMFGYRFGARHSVSFGMAFSPLVRMKNEDVGFGIPWEIETVVVNENGPRAGFANFDVAGLIGYRMQLTQRWFANAQMRYGLFDITDDSFFASGDVNHHNHQLRVGLSYRFVNR